MVNGITPPSVREFWVPRTEDDGSTLRRALVDATAWTRAEQSHVARVLLAPGEHRIAPASPEADESAIVIEDAARITIEGEGVELLFSDPHRGGIDVRDSCDITLRGFTIDYAEPSFTQGTVIAVDATTGTFRFRPAEGYPDFTDRTLFTGSGYGTLRTSDGVLKPGGRQTFMITYQSVAQPDGSFLVSVETSDRAWMSDIAAGDGFVVGHRGDRHGIRFTGCARVGIAEVTIHAAPCAAILAHETSALVLESVTVARRPGSTRWISTNADAVHCQGGRRGPQIIGCRFEGMHDDGVNLYVHGMRLTQVHNPRTVVLDGTGVIAAGDVLQFVDAASGAVLAETSVASVSATRPPVIHLDADLPEHAAPGTTVYNRSNALPGFRIEACRFHDFRGIGIRLKASSGVVADCRFERLSGCGLWIANDPGWTEGPLGSRDVDVVGSRFLATPSDTSLQSWPHSAATVMIELFSAADGPAAARAHERICVRDTDIEQLALAAVYVGGAVGVTIEDMRVRERAGAAWLATRDSDVRVAETTGIVE